MSGTLYCYEFLPVLPLDEVEITLLLAAYGVESLYGEVQARLDAAHAFDADQRRCVIDASTPVGRDFNKLFAGYLYREFGDGGFTIERLEDPAVRRDRSADNGEAIFGTGSR